MKNIMGFVYSDDFLFFSICCMPTLIALMTYVISAWNKSITRRRLVFLLKFIVWGFAYGLNSLSKKLLKFVLR